MVHRSSLLLKSKLESDPNFRSFKIRKQMISSKEMAENRKLHKKIEKLTEPVI